jgi:hypothetical protein
MWTRNGALSLCFSRICAAPSDSTWLQNALVEDWTTRLSSKRDMCPIAVLSAAPHLYRTASSRNDPNTIEPHPFGLVESAVLRAHPAHASLAAVTIFIAGVARVGVHLADPRAISAELKFQRLRIDRKRTNRTAGDEHGKCAALNQS